MHVRHHGYWFVCFCMNTDIYNLCCDGNISIVSVAISGRLRAIVARHTLTEKDRLVEKVRDATVRASGARC